MPKNLEKKANTFGLLFIGSMALNLIIVLLRDYLFFKYDAIITILNKSIKIVFLMGLICLLLAIIIEIKNYMHKKKELESKPKLTEEQQLVLKEYTMAEEVDLIRRQSLGLAYLYLISGIILLGVTIFIYWETDKKVAVFCIVFLVFYVIASYWRIKGYYKTLREVNEYFTLKYGKNKEEK